MSFAQGIRQSLFISICGLVLSLAIALPAQADCCNTICSNCPYCADMTVGTPYCGYGSCNIFGCNCDGGCRQSCAGTAEAQAPKTEAVQLFRGIDQDGDDKISLKEARAWLGDHGKKLDNDEIRDGFSKMDSDSSGYVEKGEFDSEIE